MVKFNKEKVLTPFNREKGVIGTFGYFADSEIGMERECERGEILELVHIDDDGSNFPFYSEWDGEGRGMFWNYFLPVSYEKAQEAWRKKYEVGVGDVLEVTKHWSFGENEFYYSAEGVRVGDFGEIVRIYDDEIRVKDERGEYKRYPYFAVKKVTSSYEDRQNFVLERLNETHTNISKEIKTKLVSAIQDLDIAVEEATIELRNLERVFRTGVSNIEHNQDLFGDGDAGVTYVGEFTLTVTAPFFYDGEEFSVENYDFFDEVLKDSWE